MHIKIIVFISILILHIACNKDQELAQSGIQSLQKNNKVSALVLFEKALEINPQNSLALYGKGSLMIESHITRYLGTKMLIQSLNGLSTRYQKKSYLLLGKYLNKKITKKYFKKALSQELLDIQILRKLLSLHYEDKEYKEMKELCNKYFKVYQKEYTFIQDCVYTYWQILNENEQASLILNNYFQYCNLVCIKKNHRNINLLIIYFYTLYKNYQFKEVLEKIDFYINELYHKIPDQLVVKLVTTKQKILKHNWKFIFKKPFL